MNVVLLIIDGVVSKSSKRLSKYNALYSPGETNGYNGVLVYSRVLTLVSTHGAVRLNAVGCVKATGELREGEKERRYAS